MKELEHPTPSRKYLADLSTISRTHFKKTIQFKADYAPSVITKYKSQRTGMSAVAVDREGPIVLGYFTLATEILDDSGSPHTLEHLCFMGSKNYRYKGVLDKMANRYNKVPPLAPLQSFAQINYWLCPEALRWLIGL